MSNPHIIFLHDSHIVHDIPNRAQCARVNNNYTSSKEIPWTAARCNRLLRTITSRLNILRKLSKTTLICNDFDARYRVGDADVFGNIHKHARTLGNFSSNAAASASLGREDPEWMPTRHSRAPCRTYAGASRPGKRKTRENDHDVDTFHDLRTPFVKRMIVAEPASSPVDHGTPTTKVQAKASIQSRSTRRQLPIQPTTSADKALRALLEAVKALLYSTRPVRQPSRVGARSLLGTCLRRVPAYFDLERSSIDSTATHDHDDSIETYEYLESLGSRANGGWHGLREVVRSHALHLLTEAIKDGVLSQHFFYAILDTCVERHAVAEAQRVLRAWFESEQTVVRDKLNQFIAVCSKPRFRGFIFDTLRSSLRLGSVKAYDILGNGSIWAHFMKALFRSDEQRAALLFHETFAMQIVRETASISAADYEFPAELLSISVRFLVSMYWINRELPRFAEIGRHLTHLTTAMAYTLSELDRASIVGNGERELARRCAELFGLPGLLLHTSDLQSPAIGGMTGDWSSYNSMSTLDILQETQGAIDRSHSSRPTSILYWARTIAEIDVEAGHDFVKFAAAALLEIAASAGSEARKRLSESARKLTMSWAESRDDNRSHDLYEAVENIILSEIESDTQSTPNVAQQPVLYRWEEGICEWIVKTPCVVDFEVNEDDHVSGFRDSAIDLEHDFAEVNTQYRDSDRALMMRTKFPQAADHAEDEDDLALITPLHSRQIRFQLQDEGSETESTKNHSRIPEKLFLNSRHAGICEFQAAADPDLSDDELALS